MRKIAEKIEYSPTTIYLYFQDKADLLDCICDQTLSNLEGELGRLWTCPVIRSSSCVAACEPTSNLGSATPTITRVAFLTPCPTSTEQPTRCNETGERTFDYKTPACPCVDAGVFLQSTLRSRARHSGPPSTD